MSNFDKANNLASEWVDSMGGLDNISYLYDDDVSGLVQAIHDSDLLMPDLPEPELYEGLAEFGDEEVFAACGTGKVRIYVDDARMSSESARELALMILAACECAEKEGME